MASSNSIVWTVRTIIGKIIRRGVWKLDSLQRRLLVNDGKTKSDALEVRRIAKLAYFYDQVRQISDVAAPDLDEDDTPKVPQIGRVNIVQREALMYGAEDKFFESMSHGESFETAVVRSVRALAKVGHLRRARSFSQLLQSRPETAVLGDICMAMVSIRDRVPETGWALFCKHELTTVLELASAEYFRAGFLTDPPAAAATLERVLSGEVTIESDAEQWLQVAKFSFGGGFEKSSALALERALEAAGPSADEEFLNKVEWLKSWYGKADAARGPVPSSKGTIPFAVIDYKSPDQDFASRNLGDHVQTISSLGHVVRHKGFRFSGNDELVGVANKLQSRVRADRVVEGDDAELELYLVDRDATSYHAVPEQTWTIAFGWFMHPIFGMRYDLPLNPRLRPVFVAFHVNVPALLTEEVIDYLRKYAPIGCRDWNTVHLMQAAGVPAYFSGCLTTTVDTVFTPGKNGKPKGTLFVDSPKTSEGDFFKQVFRAVRERPFAENIDEALERLESYRSTYKRVVTSRLHCYLPARSIGSNVEFRPKNPADVRFDGLANIDDTAYDAIRNGMLEKLNVFVSAIAAGKSEEEVYALWREVNAEDVAYAQSKHAKIDEIAEPTFDVQAACQAVLAKSVVMERTQDAGGGEEINIEFSLDGNLKHQLAVVLESVVTNATRPIRAFVLCRDHDKTDYDRIARAFPTVSFVWLPTDDVDYGDIIGMIVHITVATMDRLLLPELLPDVKRIIHHDLDALCFGDVAELFETDLGGNPIAARTSPQSDIRSGFGGLIKASKRLKNNQDMARELIIRSHARHVYDFLGFNAGVMVLDLDRMRADQFCRYFLPYAERFGMNDQEILNAYAGAERAELDPDWNRLPRLEIVESPKIVHWAGFQKPWNAEYVQYRESWDEMDAKVTVRLDSIDAP